MAIDLTGLILKGRYCILEQIGRGGEGRLFLARDLELGTLWAVKEISISQNREAKLLRLLEHPSLPRMVDYFEKEDACYLVMEYIKGKSLAQLLQEGRKFSRAEIIEVGITCARVLACLHSRKPPVYYGDLKPDNLMLSDNGKLYLVDFGSAVFGFTHQQRVCQGTKGYAAPEQYHGRISSASDIYTLGKTLEAIMGKDRWKLLTGSPRLFYVLWKCCRHEEVQRYQDMRSVEKALDTIKMDQVRSRSSGLAAGVLAAGILAAGVSIFLQSERNVDFSKVLGKVTDSYHKDTFLLGDTKEQKEICRDTEMRLQELLSDYGQKEQQRRLLLLLAVNSEYQGEEERCALYYEQLLLYHSGYREGYGEYGMFLWRMGQKEESARLWKDYQKKAEEKLLEDGKCRNLTLWEERIHEWEREKKRKKESQDQ